MAMMAADDCTHMVSTPPMRRNNNVVQMLLGLKEEKKFIIVSLCAKSISAAFMRSVESAKNRNAKPNRNSPTDFPVFFFWNKRIMPMKKTGQAKLLISTEKPKNAINHAVTVVPMLAPMITLIACANVSSPALTKLTVRTVVAVDDCTAAVTNVPVSKPVKRLRVIAPMMFRR